MSVTGTWVSGLCRLPGDGCPGLCGVGAPKENEVFVKEKVADTTQKERIQSGIVITRAPV